jgi:hypothetical protein
MRNSYLFIIVGIISTILGVITAILINNFIS